MEINEIKYFLEHCLSKSPIEGNIPNVGKYNFPQLSQVNYLPELPIYPFNYLKSTFSKERCWYHCFTSAKNFHRLYHSFDEYVPLLQQSKGLISADFSLYRDYPEEILIANCRANRLIDYALQQAGIPMIPTAGFAGESSWEWCFDGLPVQSTLAVTTNTLRGDMEAKRLFVGGINVMVKKLQPTAIVVCGKCPVWIANKFPTINVIQIPNYVTMWHERERRAKLNGRLRRNEWKS